MISVTQSGFDFGDGYPAPEVIQPKERAPRVVPPQKEKLISKKVVAVPKPLINENSTLKDIREVANRLLKKEFGIDGNLPGWAHLVDLKTSELTCKTDMTTLSDFVDLAKSRHDCRHDCRHAPT